MIGVKHVTGSKDKARASAPHGQCYLCTAANLKAFDVSSLSGSFNARNLQAGLILILHKFPYSPRLSLTFEIPLLDVVALVNICSVSTASPKAFTH